MATMKNIPLQDHIGRSVAQVVPEAFPQVEPALRRALAGESISAIEFRIPNASQPDGYSTLLSSYQPIRDAADEIVGISVATMDITERKRIEQALAESEAPLPPDAGTASGVVVDGGCRGHDHRCRPAMGHAHRIAREQALGDGWIKGVHPDDAAQAMHRWQQSVRSGQPCDIEYRCGREEDGWHRVRVRAVARRGASGEIIQWYGTLEIPCTSDPQASRDPFPSSHPQAPLPDPAPQTASLAGPGNHSLPATPR